MSYDGPAKLKLKERLADTLTKAEAVPIDLVLLYDASGSVSSDQFLMAKQAGMMLINAFSVDTFIGAGQFGNQFRRECPLTNDRNLLQQQHTKMQQMGGGTNTADALATGALPLLVSGRPTALKYVFLFTDGAPNDQGATIIAANSVRGMGATILGVGIGNVNQVQLEQVCGAGNVFVLSDWNALISAIPSVESRRSRLVPNSEVVLAVEQTERPVGFGDVLPLKITIKNKGDVVIQKGSKIRVEGESNDEKRVSAFYEPEIAIIDKEIRALNGQLDVSIKLTPTANASIETLPEIININISPPNQPKVFYNTKNAGLVVELYNMVGDVYNWRPKKDYCVPNERANILVFGIAGVGKSTLVNHFYSLYKETFETKAASFQSADHVTLKNEFHRAVDSVQFLDTVGLNMATDNWGNGELDQVIAGTLPSNYELNNKASLAKALKEGITSKEEREIHACVVVITHNFMSAEESEKQHLRQYIQLLARKNLNPIVVVTRMDEINNPDRLQRLPKDAAETTSLAERDIFFLDNRPKDKPDLATRKTIFKILDRLLKNANLFHERMHKKRGSSGSSVLPTSKSVTPSNEIASQYTIQLDNGAILGDVFDTLTSDMNLLSLRSQIEGQLSAPSFQFITNNTNSPIGVNAEEKVNVNKVIIQTNSGTPLIRIKSQQSAPPPY